MRVLLCADIGTTKTGFFHAGDEAMFLATYDAYMAKQPQTQLSAMSRSKTYINLKLQEYAYHAISLYSHKPVLQYLRFSLKVLAYRYFKRVFFNKEEQKLINLIKKQDVIHFCGGGNLNSHFPNILYYFVSIITASKILGKRVILTSQTIGPLSVIDRVFTCTAFNYADSITLREQVHSRYPLLKYGIIRSNVRGGFDAAYSLSSNGAVRLPKKKGIRIGVSIHNWKKSNIIKQHIIDILNELSKTHKVQVVLIPHQLNKLHEFDDIAFMNDFKEQLFRSIDVIEVPYNHIPFTKLPSFIKQLTSHMDILLTTRYHGVIFALSTNTPCIAYSSDDYTHHKNLSAFKHLYNGSSKKYDVRLTTNTIVNKKIIAVIEQYASERNALKKLNKQIKPDYNHFSYYV